MQVKWYAGRQQQKREGLEQQKKKKKGEPRLAWQIKSAV